MDNVSKWWNTDSEAEALRKFWQAEDRQQLDRQQRKITAIVLGLFVLCLLALAEIVR